MFIDPSAFNANEPGPPRSAGVKLPPSSPSMLLENYGMTGSAPDAVIHSGRRDRESEH
jgi:hypothetical protein